MRPDMKAFRLVVAGELEKEASAPIDFVKKHHEALGHAAEVAGLGVLAKPSFDALHKTPASEDTERVQKRHAKYELAGLGILAAPSAIHLGHKLWKGAKGLGKK